MKTSIIFLLLLLIFNASTSGSEQTPQVYFLDSLRVTLSNKDKIIGTIDSLTNDSLFLFVNNRQIAVPLGKITKLEVALGQKSKTFKYARNGFLIGGLLLGSLTGYSAWKDSKREEREMFEIIIPWEYAFLTGFISGGVLGACAGAIEGNKRMVTNWEEISIEELRTAYSTWHSRDRNIQQTGRPVDKQSK